MPPVKPIGIRSSLFSHSFPTFYACYLLKSIQTPNSTTTYIGSTPSPLRRIRQHNGELAQGARKTRLKRPWVMQMIVHGFPSRLAALQFEWAWQHPHKSRHMRDGKTAIFGSHAHKTLQKNILILRTMISRPPFDTWPLHVKLFTHEAHQYWNDSITNDVASPLPPGFTCTLELEGVDGKSGHAGSGRQGPISVNDEEFTSAILAKNTAIAAAAGNVECTICREPILNYAASPLLTALCPSSNCHVVSHLKCLSQYFINQEDRQTTMVPRGGHCKSCKQYTLWGDIIRGCYRRMPPSEVAGPLLDVDTDDMFVSDNSEIQGKTKSSESRKKSASPTKLRNSPKETGKQTSSKSIIHDSEIFDLSNLVTSSESEDIPGPVKKKLGRPRKVLAMFSPPTIRQLSLKDSGIPRQSDCVSTTEGENFNCVARSEIEDNATPAKQKRGQPRKDLAILSSGATSSVLSPQPLKASRKTKRIVSPSKPELSSKGKGSRSFSSLSTSEGETFDFNNLVARSGSRATSTPAKRQRGWPGKDMSLLGLTSPLDTKKPRDITPTDHRELSKEKGKQKRAFSPISLISSSEDETYDLNHLLASPEREDTSMPIKRQREPARGTPAVICAPIELGQSSKGKEQHFDWSNIVPRSADMSNSAKIKLRRSPKNTVLLSAGGISISSTQPHKSLRDQNVPGLTRTVYHGRCQDVKVNSDDSSFPESFNFSGIHDNDDNNENVTRNQNLGPNHRDVRTAKIKWSLDRKANSKASTRTMHGLERAMSAISLTPQKAPFHKDQSNVQVIEVSD